jgi:cbb3-type cytochrome oxidase maturation protein
LASPEGWVWFEMSVIYIVLPLALLFVLVAVGFFIWAARRGQFDDLETPAHRVLFEDSFTDSQATREDEEPNPKSQAGQE